MVTELVLPPLLDVVLVLSIVVGFASLTMAFTSTILGELQIENSVTIADIAKQKANRISVDFKLRVCAILLLIRGGCVNVSSSVLF